MGVDRESRLLMGREEPLLGGGCWEGGMNYPGMSFVEERVECELREEDGLAVDAGKSQININL